MGQRIDEMDKINTIAVLGTGTMGIDLGLLAALHGFDVFLWHRTDQGVAIERMNKRLEKYVVKGILTPTQRQVAIDRIRATSDLNDLSAVELVIETIVEDLTEKSKLLSRVGRVVSGKCIITSNTSSLSIEDLANHTGISERFAGLHFFNPVLKMELVEIITCSKTSSKTIELLRQAVACFGKTTVEVNDSPGFIVNRLMSCQIREAILLVEQGIASADDIDVAVKLGLAHPIGPLALADLVGLDVMLSIFEALHEDAKLPAFRPPELLKKMVTEGTLGRKAGQGFFQY